MPPEAEADKFIAVPLQVVTDDPLLMLTVVVGVTVATTAVRGVLSQLAADTDVT